jgi:DNA uptake protein ComE-like DNA-binding protein
VLQTTIMRMTTREGSTRLAPLLKLQVNEASFLQLASLPGLGPVTARRVMAFREQHGPIRSLPQLIQIICGAKGRGGKGLKELANYADFS